MGASEFTDGTWAWPEGLAHFVENYDVQLPDEFVRHALSPLERMVPNPWIQSHTSALPGTR